MIHDPLLPPPPPAPPDGHGRHDSFHHTAPARTAPARAKHPAMSARILATGLAATGTLGLTAGYAAGARADAQPSLLDNMSLTDGSQSVAPLAPAMPHQPSETQPVPQQGNGRVIQVPVPGISPATPGSSAGSTSDWQQPPQGPAQQQSSGSH